MPKRKHKQAAKLRTAIELPAREAETFDRIFVREILLTRPEGPEGRLEVSAAGVLAKVGIEPRTVLVEEGGEVQSSTRDVEVLQLASTAGGALVRRQIKLSDAEVILSEAAQSAIDVLAEELGPIIEERGN